MIWIFLIDVCCGAWLMWAVLWLCGCIRTRAEFDAAQGQGTADPPLCKHCGHAL